MGYPFAKDDKEAMAWGQCDFCTTDMGTPGYRRRPMHKCQRHVCGWVYCDDCKTHSRVCTFCHEELKEKKATDVD